MILYGRRNRLKIAGMKLNLKEKINNSAASRQIRTFSRQIRYASWIFGARTAKVRFFSSTPNTLNSNRECLFYSSFIPTTSENDNFYRVPAQHGCVSARLKLSLSLDIQLPLCVSVHVLVGWFCCVSATRCRYVSLCIVVLCFQIQNINASEWECDKYDNITDIFFVRILLKIQFYILVRTAVAAGVVVVVTLLLLLGSAIWQLSYFFHAVSLLSLSRCGILSLLEFFFIRIYRMSASHDLEFIYIYRCSSMQWNT